MRASSSPIGRRAAFARRSAIATTCPGLPTTAASSSTRATTAAARRCFLPTRAGFSTTPSPTMRRARTRRPISSGNRRRGSAIAAGRWNFASRSRRCATAPPIHRRGASCSIATTHVISDISSSPRGGNCFICRSNPLVGLEHLPAGGHIVAAPDITASETARPRGELGAPIVNAPVKPHAGLDVKYTPNADNAIDLTAKPDFSQVESDTAQIAANERFALFFPEKRPFFLEGVNLLATPIQAVYTRTITAPRWGGRATGKEGGITYTALAAEDAGGGSVMIPG